MGAFDWISAPVWPNSFSPPREKGVDLRQPFHTPISAPWSGTVSQVLTGRPWGAEVDVVLDKPVGGASQYSLVHLDQIAGGIVPGAHIGAGQPLGLSGGQNSGGSNPASPIYSSGPHVEVDLWQGTPWGSTPSINPLPYLQQVQAGGGPSDTSGGSGNPFVDAIGSGLTAAGDSFLHGLGLTSLKDLAWRTLFIAGGLILVLLGVLALITAFAEDHGVPVVGGSGDGGGGGGGGQSGGQSGGEGLARGAALAAEGA